MCHSVHVEVRGLLGGVSSVLPPCEFWDSNLMLSGLVASTFTQGVNSLALIVASCRTPENQFFSCFLYAASQKNGGVTFRGPSVGIQNSSTVARNGVEQRFIIWR